MFEPLEPRDVEPQVELFELGPLSDPRTRLVERKPAPARDLDAADTVVCLGSELTAEEVAEARQVAAGTGAAVGATREVCDRGDLPRNRQIGLYGRAVAPRLLVTVGVGGDFEHTTGFVKAHVIAAVTADAGSPMLQSADVGLVGAWRELLPALL
jgi:electron transfer flavoprotein alpha subunit